MTQPRCIISFALLLASLVSLYGCGSGGSSGSSTPPANQPSPQVQTLTITSISPTSPTPTSVVDIGTSGLDTSKPVVVSFTNSSGFTANVSAIGVKSDGTVASAVPIYFDPVTGNEGPGTVSVAISQNGQTSAQFSTPLSIQALPNTASGLPLGQLSRAFLNYQAMKIARRLNEMQAYQALPSNTVDTTAAQADLTSLLNKTVEARNDVDRIILNPNLVFMVGTMANGFPLQYDQNSVATMDRIYALKLAEMAPAINSVISGKPLLIDAVGKRGGHILNMRGHLLTHKRMLRARARPLLTGASIDLNSLAQALGVAGNLTGISQAYSDYLHNTPGSVEQSIAIQAGFVGAFQLATINAPPGSLVQRAGSLMGAVVAGEGLLVNFGEELGDLAFIMVASRNGTDPSVIAEAQADLQQNATAAWFNTINAEINLAGFGTGAPTSFWGPYGTALNQALLTDGGQVAMQSAALVSGIEQCFANTTSSCLQLDQDITAKLAAETSSVFNTAGVGFADVLGSAQVSNSQGPVLSPDAGIELGPFDGNVNMQSLADPTGNYDVFVTVGSPNTNYAAISDTVYDPVGNLALATLTIDLSTLTAAANGPEPVEVPIVAMCNDTDAPNPDGDDPDCD